MEPLAEGAAVSLRPIERGDLATIVDHPWSVSVTEPLDDADRLAEVLAQTGFATDDATAVAIVDRWSGRMIGTLQAFRAAPTIHGLEIGYLIHDPADRGRGAASEALRLLVDHIFETRATIHRIQLLIEIANTASWHVAERNGFMREGILRNSGLGDGVPADSYVYSRVRAEHEAVASTG